jgi:hypothetical protein
MTENNAKKAQPTHTGFVASAGEEAALRIVVEQRRKDRRITAADIKYRLEVLGADPD